MSLHTDLNSPLLLESLTPLLNCKDIHLNVRTLRYQELADKDSARPSAELRRRVNRATVVQQQRFQKKCANAQIAACDLD